MFLPRRADVEQPVPKSLLGRRNYGDIPVTVLRLVHLGDSTTSALHNAANRVVNDTCMAVWSVCSGWGLPAVVHVTVMPA